jgi:hypothetical protein
MSIIPEEIQSFTTLWRRFLEVDENGVVYKQTVETLGSAK